LGGFLLVTSIGGPAIEHARRRTKRIGEEVKRLERDVKREMREVIER
jgi:hypothetical protein